MMIHTKFTLSMTVLGVLINKSQVMSLHFFPHSRRANATVCMKVKSWNEKLAIYFLTGISIVHKLYEKLGFFIKKKSGLHYPIFMVFIPTSAVWNHSSSESL